MLSPHTRKTVAGINVLTWGALTGPVSWFVPTLEGLWFERAALFLCMLGLVIPAADVWVSADVRTQQDTATE